MNKKILILLVLGMIFPLVANAFFFGFGTSGGVDQVIRKGQESGAISTQPGQPGGGDGNGNGPGALAISNVSYQLKEADNGDYYYIDVNFNTNKSVSKITVSWRRDSFAPGGWYSKHKNTSGTVHAISVKYVKPDTTTYFVVKAIAGTENAQSDQYSVATPYASQKVYDVYINIVSGQYRLVWSYFVASPPNNFSAIWSKDGVNWFPWTVDPPSGQKYYTNYAGSGWQTGDQLDVDFYNPSDRSETNIQDSIFYGNQSF